MPWTPPLSQGLRLQGGGLQVLGHKRLWQEWGQVGSPQTIFWCCPDASLPGNTTHACSSRQAAGQLSPWGGMALGVKPGMGLGTGAELSHLVPQASWLPGLSPALS